jgi:propionyl-CoA carboxylase alpha chain
MRRLLVANRGEIARRVFRTAREMGISTVAVYSDADAHLPFVREADLAVRLPGSHPAETYLRGDLVIQAARRTRVDAVHPGYGFLSENAEFARAVIDAGLIWVGPPPGAIEAMGSKLGAKRLMRSAGVPTLPWAESIDAAQDVGYPLLVKASAGGGGRGMRIVRDPADLVNAVEAASREASGAFGDATVFLERYLEAPRHIEVQIFADTHGNVVSLFERECSIQRRYQKVVEEAPSPAVDEPLRVELGEAAVAAARAVGYVGAGTVEFVMAADGSYAFLEMNTRLQVEHPVTERITGFDLVRLQLLVAVGEPLPEEVLAPSINGHAIEVRLYAEDATRDFLPCTGTLRSFEFPDTVRLDSGFESGSVVSQYYDAMLAKVIAHAPTREEAAAKLSAALRSARVHGVISNRDLLVRILEEPTYLAGLTDTAYLDRHPATELGTPLLGTEAEGRCRAAVAAIALQAANRRSATVLARLPSGWRNNPSSAQTVTLDDGDQRFAVRYRLGRAGAITLTVDNCPVDFDLHIASVPMIDATLNGVRFCSHIAISSDLKTIDVDSPFGASSYAVVPRFTNPADLIAVGSLVAPMPGTVVRVLTQKDAKVAKGDPVLVLEAMKMEHTVASPADGVLTEIRVEPGQQVQTGTILAVLDSIRVLDRPSPE